MPIHFSFENIYVRHASYSLQEESPTQMEDAFKLFRDFSDLKQLVSLAN